MTKEERKKMEDWFNERTRRHINLVHKYMARIALSDRKYVDLIDRFGEHDASKFLDPEVEPYVYISWDYKCKDDGVEFKVPKAISDKMNEATQHHVLNNSHHPEYHCGKKTNLINRSDRDKPPEELIDATKMPDLDIAEMCADWCAMSEEKGSKPQDWAKKNVNVRWKFTNKQAKLIDKLLAVAWTKREPE
jgi:hypothetical protein